MAEQKKKNNSSKNVKENTKKKEENKKVSEVNNKTKKNTVKEEKKDKEVKIVEETIEETVKEETQEEEIVKKEEKIKKEEKNKENNNFVKKHLSDIILVGLAVVLVLIGLLCFNGNESNKDAESNLVELTYSEYTDLINTGEPFVFIVERTTCSHCANYMPVAEKFANSNDVKIYYIDTDTLTEEEFTSLQSSNSFFIENAEDWGTPTTMVVKGNEVLDTLVGESDKAGLKQFLEKNGIME